MKVIFILILLLLLSKSGIYMFIIFDVLRIMFLFIKIEGGVILIFRLFCENSVDVFFIIMFVILLIVFFVSLLNFDIGKFFIIIDVMCFVVLIDM